MKGNVKKLLIILAVVVIAFIIFMFIRGGSNESDALLESSGGVGRDTDAADIIGAEIIQALNQINSLQLDTSIFDRPEYASLVDFSQEITLEPVGRENPFAPIGIGNISQSESLIIIDGDGDTEAGDSSDTDPSSGSNSGTDEGGTDSGSATSSGSVNN